MAAKTKFFRVAVEGATTDGRKIERSWLEQIAKNYNREKYAARVFVEHIRGISPEWGFRCLGDVIAVKTEEFEMDGQKKLALYAQIEPTEQFIAYTRDKQKIYSSIEVNADFMGTGEAYLMGLGATDTPASMGTEILAFAAQNPAANPFATRKQHPDNVFSAAIESAIEFEPQEASWFTRVVEMLRGKADRPEADQRYNDMGRAVETVAQATAENAEGVANLRQEFQLLRAEVVTLKATTTDIGQRIDHTPSAARSRAPATGGQTVIATDC